MNEKITVSEEGQDGGGRPPALDEAKRRLVLALLTNCFSRRMAARYIGCAHSTIAQTAARDPAFATDLAQAEHGVDVEMLAAVRRAAKQDRHWRAAAWLLERRNRGEFSLATSGRDNPKGNAVDEERRQLINTLMLAAIQQRPKPDGADPSSARMVGAGHGGA